MKCLFFILAVTMLFAGCTKTDSQQTPSYDSETEMIWKAIDGSYTSTFYIMHTDSVWYWETIAFHPAEAPYKKHEYDIFGTATMTQRYPSGTVYSDDHYYSIGSRYSNRTITFLKIGLNGGFSNYLECCIADVSPSSFRMWHYGASEEYNSHTYYKDIP